MSKIVKKVIENVQLPEIDMKKNYKVARFFFDLFHPHFLKPLYKMWDYKVTVMDHEVPVRIFSPNERGIYPIIIFYHGGGWVTGNINSYSKLCSTLANMTDHVVVSIDYRLAPEYPFPEGFNDCYEVTKMIYKRPGLFYTKTDDIVIMGDSAGGNIAAAISQRARDTKEFKVKKQVLVYPVVSVKHGSDTPFESCVKYQNNLTLSAKRINEFTDLYRSSQDDDTNPYFAPLEAKNFKDQPDTLIFTAELDVLRDEAEYYGKMLKEANNKVKVVRIKEVGHGYFSLSENLPSVKQTYLELISFLKGVTNEKK